MSECTGNHKDGNNADNFIPSFEWYQHFIERHNLSVCCWTHTTKKLSAKFEDNLQEFQHFIRQHDTMEYDLSQRKKDKITLTMDKISADKIDEIVMMLTFDTDSSEAN